MAEDSDRWERVQRSSASREAFQAKPSPVALHNTAERRRNLDQEEAARDRLVFLWVVFFLGAAGLVLLLVFAANRMAPAAG